MSGKRHGKKKQVKKKPQARTAQAAGATPVADSLDALLASRYHGASNIRGVRFQVRYSVLRCAELAAAQRRGEAPATRLRFEGLEDLDALGDLRHPGLRVVTAEELVQLKSSTAGWTWSGLTDPVTNFLEAYRTDAELHFRLVINFTPWGELAELVRLQERSASERDRVVGRFRTLIKRLGGSAAEADRLLARMVLEPLLEEDLRRRTRAALAEAAGAADVGALDALEAILAARVLEWAAERATAGAPEALDTLRTACEGMQRAERYQAVEHRWVGPVEYVPDAAPTDFFAGKRVRIGHIVEGLDVRRPRWLDKIDTALSTVPVCVVRAPSGHGKSTLAFRYAVERWPASQTVLVRSAGTIEEVSAVADYLRYRVALGAPVRVLIDADFDTRRWAEVAQAAAAAGAQVLVTVRTEDWQRYDLRALTSREVIEPKLDLEEAREIFSAFKGRNQIHPAVRSAPEAYERLRPPHLLLEFVHLVTQGRMLEDRLRDQVRAFAALREDPAKKRLLRLVSLANALGAPVQLTAALRAVPLRDDPQDVVGTMVGEYLALDEGRLVPLHWVRSDHLSRILHEGGIPPVTDTAAEALEVVPPESLSFFVANAFRREDIEREEFLRRLVDRFGASDPELLLRILDGLFEAGERDFYTVNRGLFEEAQGILGPTGVLLVAMEAAPVVRVGALRRMTQIGRDRPEIAADQLLPLADRLHPAPRGRDWVRRFLERGAERIQLPYADSATGRLLDWCAITGIQLPDWDATRARLLADEGVFGRGLEALCDFAQGLFRYDRGAYDEWYATIQTDLLPFLQLETECASLELIPPVANDPDHADDLQWQEDARRDHAEHGNPAAEVVITYLVDHESGVKPNDQSVRRLETLRRALPFAGRYHASGRTFMPGGLEVPFDDTRKAMPRWNLPYPSDIAKNVVSRQVIQAEFAADTYYGLQEAWYNLRTRGLRLVEAIGTILQSLLEGKPFSLDRVLGPGEEVVHLFEATARDVPIPDVEELERLGPLSEELRVVAQLGGPRRWLNDVQTFRGQFWAYSNQRDPQVGRLLVHNFRDAQDHLNGLHDFFRVLFQEHADHFQARELDMREREVYARVELLLEGWVLEPPDPGPGSALKRLTARRKARDAAVIEQVRQALEALGEIADATVYPTGVHREAYITSLPLGVPIADPLEPLEELLAIGAALEPVADLADVFWLFPLRGGAWVGPGAHQVRALSLRGEGDERLLLAAALGIMVPMEPPEQIAALLPGLARVERPAPNLPQKVAGLALTIQWYVHQRDIVAEVPGADRHPWRLELERRLRARLQPSEDEVRSLIRTVTGDIAALGGSLDQAVAEARAELMRWLTEVEGALASDRIATESRSRLDPEEINALAVLASLEAESELQREVSGE
jgi:hypothetical protein